MTKEKKQKQIIVSHVIMKGYIHHENGKKTMFELNKNDFKPIELEGIFNGVSRTL